MAGERRLADPAHERGLVGIRLIEAADDHELVARRGPSLRGRHRCPCARSRTRRTRGAPSGARSTARAPRRAPRRQDDTRDRRRVRERGGSARAAGGRGTTTASGARNPGRTTMTSRPNSARGRPRQVERAASGSEPVRGKYSCQVWTTGTPVSTESGRQMPGSLPSAAGRETGCGRVRLPGADADRVTEPASASLQPASRGNTSNPARRGRVRRRAREDADLDVLAPRTARPRARARSRRPRRPSEGRSPMTRRTLTRPPRRRGPQRAGPFTVHRSREAAPRGRGRRA